MTSAARHPRFLSLAFVAALIAALAITVTPDANAGLIGTGPASGCDEASQVFERWGDRNNYLLVPGGSFEAGGPAWTLSGGTGVVSGNEPFYVRSSGDGNSLFLPAGSSALSPTVCFGLGDWHSRFFVRNVGSARGSLKVDVVVRSALGLLTFLDGGTISGTGAWAPSPRIGLTVTNVCSLLGVRAVSFRFRSVGTGAAFQVDDVYLDPWKSF
ncbi:MAG TPA: hypothetical protein VFP24_04590 [Gaiellaceae bacterium]|nr:hypothetical protein [Gaiellaceae bacterium]